MAHRTHRHELHLTELAAAGPAPAPKPLPAPPRNPRRRGLGIDHAAERHAVRAELHGIERGVDWDELDAPADR
jgi:hypothetical protein